MIGFVVIQVGGGLFNRIYLKDKNSKSNLIRIMKICHKLFGYFLGIIYKINILWSWYDVPLSLVTYILIAWDILTLIVIVILKVYNKRLEQIIITP